MGSFRWRSYHGLRYELKPWRSGASTTQATAPALRLIRGVQTRRSITCPVLMRPKLNRCLLNGINSGTPPTVIASAASLDYSPLTVEDCQGS